MANGYKIPKDIETEIRSRDVQCVYCRKTMVPTTTPFRADNATIEHLDHLPPFMFREGQTAADFAIACRHCNCTLRKDKPLAVFVAEQGIADTVAPVVTAWLNRARRESITKPSRRPTGPNFGPSSPGPAHRRPGAGASRDFRVRAVFSAAQSVAQSADFVAKISPPDRLKCFILQV